MPFGVLKTITAKSNIMTTANKTIKAKANISQLYTPLGIFSRLLDTKVNIERKTTAKDSTGDLNETYTVNQSNIPANIQPLTAEDLNNLQGVTNNYTHRAFLPKAVKQMTDNRIIYISVRENDKIYDQESGITYRIRQIEDYILANKYKSRTKLHHYELILERLNDIRYD
jgi:hypothetical protein